MNITKDRLETTILEANNKGFERGAFAATLMLIEAFMSAVAAKGLPPAVGLEMLKNVDLDHGEKIPAFVEKVVNRFNE